MPNEKRDEAKLSEIYVGFGDETIVRFHCQTAGLLKVPWLPYEAYEAVITGGKMDGCAFPGATGVSTNAEFLYPAELTGKTSKIYVDWCNGETVDDGYVKINAGDAEENGTDFDEIGEGDKLSFVGDGQKPDFKAIATIILDDGYEKTIFFKKEPKVIDESDIDEATANLYRKPAKAQKEGKQNAI
jgi:hypothetical protein